MRSTRTNSPCFSPSIRGHPKGTVDQATITAFLTHLKDAGVDPDEVITDGAAMYPPVLAQVWPKAAHQLCLFHETRRVTAAVLDVEGGSQGAPGAAVFGAPPPGAGDLARSSRSPRRPTSRRIAQGEAAFAEVHALREKRVSLREIARTVGLNRRTVTAWLKQEKPNPDATVNAASLPIPPSDNEASPPGPWESWEQLRTVRADLRTDRFLLVRHPDHLDPGEESRLRALLDSPIGADLRLVRQFLTDWFAIWRDEVGERRGGPEARQHYEAWQTNADYRRLAPLRRVQQSVDKERFQRLSQFLHDLRWEATNNGAERIGRTFRHRQRPHFNLRTQASIDEALKVRASLHRDAVTSACQVFGNRSPRGRPRRREQGDRPLPIAA